MKVTKETIVRSVILLIALVNQVLTSTGHSVLPFDDQTITELFTLVFTIVSATVAWWKNNSFTQEAMKADEYMKDLKSSK